MQKKAKEWLAGSITVLAGIATIVTAGVTLMNDTPSPSSQDRSSAPAPQQNVHEEPSRRPNLLFPEFSAAIETQDDAARLLDFLSDNTDQIVELDIVSSTDAGFVQEGEFFVPLQEGLSLSHAINFTNFEPDYQHGDHIIRGFYLVTQPGMAMGTWFYNLKEIPREEVLLRR
jgi:hypothetical protein